MTTDCATFAAGCFWGVEATFAKLNGVTATRVGYTQGHTDNPTYEDVCSGTTRHAEAVEVTFDPAVITYNELLATFWQCHDPTTLNRQGPDMGTQYRSGIYTHNTEQHQLAEASKTEAQQQFNQPIVTEIKPAQPFWPAENYHQQYLAKRGLNVSCH
jgi:peptide-methionine (S)-S-oxide reductase